MQHPIPIHGVTAATMAAALAQLGALPVAFAAACGYKAGRGEVLLLPAPNGSLAGVLLGLGTRPARDRSAAGRLALTLPPGTYELAGGFDDPGAAALAFALGGYRFTRFRRGAEPAGSEASRDDDAPRLLTPAGVDADTISLVSGAVAMGRDLINRPANDLGPDALEEAIRGLAERHGTSCTTVRGEALAAGFPLVHAVGRAAAQAPRLVEFSWGDPGDPKVTLVGKGVCFDTGGLDIKPASAMLLMKKDMGGAATALALADMVMGAHLRVALRVIVPVVENAVAGDAFRPGDVLASRKGLTVEVGNTDAEGRLILADALVLADEEAPDLLLDFATLTGAARVALGPELPPFFTDDEELAAAIARHAESANDPCWRLPLWDPYDATLKSKVADLNNMSSGPFAGAITAALFLRRFVGRAKSWAHFDVYGWNPSSRPGHPEGGEIQTALALFELLRERYRVPPGGQSV